MDRLPFEILCKILGYLKTYDVMQFCKAYGNGCFLKESSVIRCVDFHRKYELRDVNLHAFITTNFNCAFIKCLNIDYIYWIPSSKLRTLIKQMSFLEDLHALETSLGLQNEDIVEYVKLKKLAVSIKLGHLTDETKFVEKLEVLKSLCLCIIQKNWDYYFLEIVRKIPNLEELWISDEDTSFQQINYETLLESVKSLKKLVIKSKIPVRLHEQHDFLKTFECRRNGPATELIFEKISSKPERLSESTSDSKQSKLEEALEIFDIFLHDLPYGPLESRQIHLKIPVEKLHFKDLNFCQPIIFCKSKYVSAANQILASKNSATLKRLRLRSCLFKDFQAEGTSDTVGLKRLRQSSPQPNSFETISDNLRVLSELEIEICPGYRRTGLECMSDCRCNDEAVITSYSSIQKFENLCRLSLEVPPLMHGSFLKEIFLKCHYLEYLNITCVESNEKFITNLYNNLKYASLLKDFRLEHKTVVLDHLLQSLSSIKSNNLQRVFVNCDNLSRDETTGESTPVYRFVQSKPQLVLFIINKSSSVKDFDKDQEKLLTLMEKNIAKIFWVNPRPIDVRKYSPHRDILYNFSTASTINIDKF